MADGELIITPRRAGGKVWLEAHWNSAWRALALLWHAPLASVMTIAAMAIAIALPAMLYLVFANANAVSGHLQRSAQLSVFLMPEMSVQRVKKISAELQIRAEVLALEVVTPEEAAAEYQRMTRGTGGLDQLGDTNPFPYVLLLELDRAIQDESQLQSLLAELRQHPGIEQVVYDQVWLSRLQAIVGLGRYLAAIVALMLALGMMVVIGNTIRLEIERQRDEIEVLQLFGGTRGFVRRPFLWTGLFYGLGGGVLAILMTVAEIALLETPIAELARSYGSQFQVVSLGAPGMLGVVVASSLLGVLGAWLAVGRYFMDADK